MAEHQALADTFADNIFAATATPAMVVRVVERGEGMITTDTGASDGIEAGDAMSCAEAIITCTLAHVRAKACDCPVCASEVRTMEMVLAAFDLHRKVGGLDG